MKIHSEDTATRAYDVIPKDANLAEWLAGAAEDDARRRLVEESANAAHEGIDRVVALARRMAAQTQERPRAELAVRITIGAALLAERMFEFSTAMLAQATGVPAPPKDSLIEILEDAIRMAEANSDLKQAGKAAMQLVARRRELAGMPPEVLQ